MTKTEVALKNEDYATFRKIAEINGVSVDIIMRNCLADWAQKFREQEWPQIQNVFENSK